MSSVKLINNQKKSNLKDLQNQIYKKSKLKNLNIK